MTFQCWIKAWSSQQHTPTHTHTHTHTHTCITCLDAPHILLQEKNVGGISLQLQRGRSRCLARAAPPRGPILPRTNKRNKSSITEPPPDGTLARRRVRQLTGHFIEPGFVAVSGEGDEALHAVDPSPFLPLPFRPSNTAFPVCPRHAVLL